MISNEHTSSTEWLTLEQAAQAFGSSARHAARQLANVDTQLIRYDQSTGGRPKKLFHYTAHPMLRCAIDSSPCSSGAPSPENSPGGRASREPQRSVSARVRPCSAPTDPADTALAMLRAQAVEEYITLRDLMPEGQAAREICARWSHPRTRKVERSERLGRYTRDRSGKVSLGGFKPSTLRKWHSLYIEGYSPLALLPRRKRRTGRRRVEIPDALLDLVHWHATRTPRADIVKGVAAASAEWPGEFPDVSLSTWQRRINERDPAGVAESLGKRGVSDFRANHSPDISRDYSAMRFNELWQLDDVQQDFYGHSALTPEKLIRPYAYAILRASTRQWICAVACEEPITQAQVRGMVGFALANPSGGIPEHIQFERGTVATTDADIKDLYNPLGITVHRTSMDGGASHSGAIPDRATGHFQGKPLVESNFRGLHNRNWDQPGQVGPDERNTAHARNEQLKALAARLAKEGKQLILPDARRWQALIHGKLEEHNNSPHGSLPEIIDPVTGERRHMSPNEYATHLGEQPINVMDESLLPLFLSKGVMLPVTRNGIHHQRRYYGRFDEDVAALAGTQVTVYALPEMPEAVYVAELGRCVEEFVEPAWGAEGDLIERKRAIEKAKRNGYEALVESARTQGASGIIELTRFTSNPTPNRRRETIAPAALTERAGRMRQAQDNLATDRQATAARFDISLSDSRPLASIRGSSPSSKKGLLATASEIREQNTILKGGINAPLDAFANL